MNRRGFFSFAAAAPIGIVAAVKTMPAEIATLPVAGPGLPITKFTTIHSPQLYHGGLDYIDTYWIGYKDAVLLAQARDDTGR